MPFELFTAIAKAVAYVAALSGAGIVLAGATLSPQLGVGAAVDNLRRAAGAVLTAASLARYALLFVGLGGDPSAALLGALFASHSGVAIAMQLTGGALLWRGPETWMPFAAAMLVIASFGVAGHAPSNGFPLALVVAAHVGMASWWIGGLVILSGALGRMGRSAFISLVEVFSRQAVVAVSILFAAGAATALVLLAMRVDLARSYDAGLAAKVALASAVLALAAVNKFILTPDLRTRRRAFRRLRAAIAVELALFLATVTATAVLTTLWSPH